MRTPLHNNLFTVHKGYSPTAVSKNSLCTHNGAWVLNKCVFKLSFSVLTRNNNYIFYIFFDVANNIDIVMKGKVFDNEIIQSSSVHNYETLRNCTVQSRPLLIGIYSNMMLKLLQEPPLSSSTIASSNTPYCMHL